MSIDFSKPVQTRDGRKVRIYTTEGKDPARPVVGEYCDNDTYWWVFSWRLDGLQQEGLSFPRDLVNVPQKHTAWLNVNPTNRGYFGSEYCCLYDSRASADRYAPANRIACIQVTYTEGEGLE